MRAHGHSNVQEGVVVTVDDTSISISLEDTLEDEDESSLYIVLKLTSDVTHKRYTAALEALEAAYGNPAHVAHTLLHVLLDARVPRFAENVGVVNEKCLEQLNEAQRSAVIWAMKAKDLSVFHGPPGTGKTHTVVAYVLAEVARGNRVLIVAPSNVAVDNVAERLAASTQRLNFVRAGHPARIIPSVVKYGLEAQLAKTEDAELVRDIRAELESLETQISKTKEKGGRRGLRAEQKELRRELRVREREAIKRLLTSMDVVLATISGAGARILDIAADATPFDIVVIDEAAQALEAACWVPLLRASKAILAGDPFQLAGTVKSVTAEERGLKRSILDRVFASPSLEPCITMLCTQYRMNTVISNWSSQEFYNSKLVADSAVAEHRVVDLESCKTEVEDDQNLVNPFIVIDTAGGDCEENLLSEDIVQDAAAAPSSIATASRSNKGEAEIVTCVVNEFIACGLSRQEIAIISPYSGQVELLRRLLWPTHGRALEVATVDSFQGREKEVVCISLVRSNEQGEVGFLSDNRRLNVAITRARRGVVIVCDSETVSTHPLLSRMIEYAENFGHYRSAVTDFPDIVGTVSLQRRPNEAIEAEQRSMAKRKQRPKSKAPKSHSMSSVPESEQKAFNTNTSIRWSENSNQDGIGLKDQLRNEIVCFCESDVSEKIFPTNLSSVGRKRVHELAEKLGLGHETTDVPGGRQIRVWKREAGKQEAYSSSGITRVGQDFAKPSYVVTSNPRPASFGLLGENDSDNAAEQSSAVVTSNNGATPHYKSINNVLEGAKQEREARQLEIEQNVARDNAAPEVNVQGAQKSFKKKKRRGKKGKQESDTDDDFDAVLARYGEPEQADRVGSTSDLVKKIMEGKVVTKSVAPRENVGAKQRLAVKLATEAEKRNRKVKQKK